MVDIPGAQDLEPHETSESPAAAEKNEAAGRGGDGTPRE